MNNAQCDKYSMAEKILRDIESVILNREVEEFVILPVTLNQNKSPVIYVENNLGLESWCVRHVYTYAYNKLLQVRKKVAKRKLLHEEYPAVNRLIIGALLINPDVSTFWNMRRELVCDNLVTVQQELKIAKIVLSHKSKSNEAFSYRKWLLRRVLNNNMEKMTMYLLFFDELQVCNTSAQKAANNYHAWTHRTWCMGHMLNLACSEHVESVIASELDYSETWSSKHVSEHTGFYYRQFILSQIKLLEIKLSQKYEDCLGQYFKGLPLKTTEIVHFVLGGTEKQWNETHLHLFHNQLCVLLYELSLNSELNNIFKEHETLWCHRRYILHELFSLMYRYYGVCTSSPSNLNLLVAHDKLDSNIVSGALLSGEKCAKMLKRSGDAARGSKIYRLVVEGESALLAKCAKLPSRHAELAGRHEKWLVYILGLTNL